MAGFADLVDDMDSMLMESLSDGRVDHLSASGSPLAEGLEAIVDQGVERLAEFGAVERLMTITVRKALIPHLDRKGGFRSNAGSPVPVMGGKVWHIDDVASDDGHLITFYVVP